MKTEKDLPMDWQKEELNKDSDGRELLPVIRKRDGRLCRFDITKISGAIYKALYATGIHSKERAEMLAVLVVKDLERVFQGTLPQVEEIQDAVERVLIQEGLIHTAKAYILYRARRTAVREGGSELMDSVDELLNQELTEHDYVRSPHTKMLKIARAASSRFYLSRVIPSQYADAHRKGEIFIHEVEYYGQAIDSIQLSLRRLLENGFNGGYAFLRPPRRVSTIAAQATVIMQCCQNELFGAVSFPCFDSEFALFTKENLHVSKDDFRQAMEGFVYNLNTLYSRTLLQFPESTVGIGLDVSDWGRAAALALLDVLDAGLGKGETPIFPEIIFYVKSGINYLPEDKNYDLFLRAVQVAAKRMNPSFVFLDSDVNRDCNPAYWGNGRRIVSFAAQGTVVGRGNIASVSVNLPRVAFFTTLRRKDYLMSSFYNELRRVVRLSADLLALRLELLGKMKVFDMPFVMGEGNYCNAERLAYDSGIYDAIVNGSLTISFSGLAEALKLLLSSQTDGVQAEELGLEIVAFLRKEVDDLAKRKGLNFVLAAQNDVLSSRHFLNLDRNDFGIMQGVTDHKYYTGGFFADENWSFEKKLAFEAPCHAYCNGGHYFYVKLSSPPSVEEAFSFVKKMYDSQVGCGGFSFPLEECKTHADAKNGTPGRDRRYRIERRSRGLELEIL